MAEHVYQTLKDIIQKYGGMNEAQVQSYMLSLRVSSIWVLYTTHMAHVILVTSFSDSYLFLLRNKLVFFN